MLQIKNTLGGSKPEGLYVWKKYEYIPEQTIVNPTFHIKANVSTQKAIITSDDINFKAFGTLTDSNNFYQSREPEFCNFMNGFKNSNSSVNFAISTSTYSGQLELNYLNNSYWNAFTKMTPTDTGAELTALNLFKTTIDDTLQYTGTKTIAAMIGEFIDYIVSDKESAYPDGAVKDGYWYERVSDVKITTGTLSVSRKTSLTIEHGLSVKPTKFILWATFLSDSDYQNGAYFSVDNDNINAGYTSLDDGSILTAQGSKETTINDIKIIIPSIKGSIYNNYYLYWNGNYNWIAIAE